MDLLRPELRQQLESGLINRIGDIAGKVDCSAVARACNHPNCLVLPFRFPMARGAA